MELGTRDHDYGIEDRCLEKREELGANGRQHVLENYSFPEFQKKWVDLMVNVHEKYGSWSERKNYKRWELIAV